MKKWSNSHSRISLNHRWGQGLLLYFSDGKRMWFLPCQGSWHNRESVWVYTRMDSDFHNAPFIGDTFESGRCAFCKTLSSATEPGLPLPTGPMAAVYWCRTKSQSSAYIPNQDSPHPGMDRIISPDPLSLPLYSSHCGWSGLSSPWARAWSCDLLWPIEWAKMRVWQFHLGSCYLFSLGLRINTLGKELLHLVCRPAVRSRVDPASRTLNHSCPSQLQIMRIAILTHWGWDGFIT